MNRTPSFSPRRRGGSPRRWAKLALLLPWLGCEGLYGGLRTDNPNHCLNKPCATGLVCQASGLCAAPDATLPAAPELSPVEHANTSDALIGAYSPTRGTLYAAASNANLWRHQPELGAPTSLTKYLNDAGVDAAQPLTGLCGSPGALIVTTSSADAAYFTLPNGPAKGQQIPLPGGVLNSCFIAPPIGPAKPVALLVGSRVLRYVDDRATVVPRALIDLNILAATVLTSVWGLSAENAWVVGSNGVLAHIEGNKALTIKTGTTDQLRGVHGAGTQVWAVGDFSTVFMTEGTTASGAQLDSNKTRLNGVWAQSEQDVWIVGDNGAVWRGAGLSFRSVASGTKKNLLAVTGNAAGEVWIVGEGGTVLRHQP